MDNLFFVYNNIKYFVEYIDKKMNIFKFYNGEKTKLTGVEEENIKTLLNSKDSYIYDSEILTNLIKGNIQIENKEYVLSYLQWLEKIIPEDCRSNLYRNIKDLKYMKKLDAYSSNNKSYSSGYPVVAEYNTKTNSLNIDEKSISELWQVAQTTDNPQEFYFKHYARVLSHELNHMASSNYNYETDISLCGFDKYPTDDISEHNRGLTEGFTEIISSAGLSNSIDSSSNYYIEASFINQLFQIIGTESFVRAYFSNLGVAPMQEELYKIIEDYNKSFQLFRDIETYFDVKDFCNEQNIVGNIQLTLLEYLDKKLDSILDYFHVDEIRRILSIYENMIITPEKIREMGKNPQQFYNVVESVNKFKSMKNRYELFINDSLKSMEK